MKPYVSIYADEDDTMTKNKTNSKNLSENDYIEDHKLIAKNYLELLTASYVKKIDAIRKN